MAVTRVTHRPASEAIQRRPRELLAETIRQVLNQISGRKPVSVAYFATATLALNALPIATSDFCRASNILRNAQAYVRAGEWAAAAYELGALQRSLPRICHEATVSSSRARLRRVNHRETSE
jgi:hypothetical protein